jgi:hypothetical protein
VVGPNPEFAENRKKCRIWSVQNRPRNSTKFINFVKVKKWENFSLFKNVQ